MIAVASIASDHETLLKNYDLWLFFTISANKPVKFFLYHFLSCCLALEDLLKTACQEPYQHTKHSK